LSRVSLLMIWHQPPSTLIPYTTLFRSDQQLEYEETAVYELDSVQVQYGTENIPTATVAVTLPTGEQVSKAATGSGSVEAIFNTLEELVQGKVHILDYRVTSVGKGQIGRASCRERG